MDPNLLDWRQRLGYGAEAASVQRLTDCTIRPRQHQHRLCGKAPQFFDDARIGSASQTGSVLPKPGRPNAATSALAVDSARLDSTTD